MKEMCLESVCYLMVHMFGDADDVSLDRRKSTTFKVQVQMDRIEHAIDKLIPFLDLFT